MTKYMEKTLQLLSELEKKMTAKLNTCSLGSLQQEIENETKRDTKDSNIQDDKISITNNIQENIQRLVTAYDSSDTVIKLEGQITVFSQQLQESIRRAGKLQSNNDKLSSTVKALTVQKQKNESSIAKLMENNRQMKKTIDKLTRQIKSRNLNRNHYVSTELPLALYTDNKTSTRTSPTLGAPGGLLLDPHAVEVQKNELKFYRDKTLSLQLEVSELQQKMEEIRQEHEQKKKHQLANSSSSKAVQMKSRKKVDECIKRSHSSTKRKPLLPAPKQKRHKTRKLGKSVEQGNIRYIL